MFTIGKYIHETSEIEFFWQNLSFTVKTLLGMQQLLMIYAKNMKNLQGVYLQIILSNLISEKLLLILSGHWKSIIINWRTIISKVLKQFDLLSNTLKNYYQLSISIRLENQNLSQLARKKETINSIATKFKYFLPEKPTKHMISTFQHYRL